MRRDDGRPLLSILIPLYNCAATLPRTLSSLGRIPPPSRPRTEVVVVNDGSPDHPLGLIRRHPLYLSSLSGPEAGFHGRMIDRRRLGAWAARNAGRPAAAGEWVLFLDAADELATDPLRALGSAEGCTALAFRVEYCRRGRSHRRVAPPA